MEKLRKKKRKLRVVIRRTIFVSIVLVCLLYASVLVGSINTSLSIEIQKMNAEIEDYKSENQQLNIEIQSLQNKDRIYTIASENGLVQSQDNIVSLNQGEVSEEE